MLTALNTEGSKEYGTSKKRQWKCLCDCGNTTVIDAALFGKRISCGCVRAETSRNNSLKSRHLVEKKDTEDRVVGKLMRLYQNNANRTKRDFTLTIEQCQDLFLSSCFYCGSEPFNTLLLNNKKSKFNYSGIDRIDNSRGYVPDNVVSCCKICNRAKHIMDQKTFTDWLIKAGNYQKMKHDNPS